MRKQACTWTIKLEQVSRHRSWSLLLCVHSANSLSSSSSLGTSLSASATTTITDSSPTFTTFTTTAQVSVTDAAPPLMHVGMEKGSNHVAASLSPSSPDNMVFASAADLKGEALDSKPQNPEPVSSHHSMAEASNVCKVYREGTGWQGID